MKKLTCLVAALAGISFVCAQRIQEKDVPSNVKAGFQKHFPEAKNVKWEKEEGNYEAGFKVQKVEHSVLLDAYGNIVESEVTINRSELSAPIKDYITKHYPGKRIKEAAKITDAKGVLTYEAEIEGMDIIFDKSGTFIKEVKD